MRCFFIIHRINIFPFPFDNKRISVYLHMNNYKFKGNHFMGRELIFDRFSQQALQTLHRYRAVMFSPTNLMR